MSAVLDREPITTISPRANTRCEEIIACTLIFNPDIPRDPLVIPAIGKDEAWLAGESWGEIRVASTDAASRINATAKFSRALRPWRDAIEKVILSRVVPLGANAAEEVERYLNLLTPLSTLEPGDCDWWIKYYGESDTLATVKKIGQLTDFSPYFARLEVHRDGPIRSGVFKQISRVLGQHCSIFNTWTKERQESGLEFGRLKRISTTEFLEMARG